MTEFSDDPPTRQALAIEGRSGRLQVTGKLKRALDAIIWEGKARAEAARNAGLADRSLRAALTKTHVRQYLAAAAKAIRNGEVVANLRTLIEVRDKSQNDMARIAAVKELRQIDEAEAKNGTPGDTVPMQPGLVIQIIGGAAPQRHDGDRPAVIDVVPERFEAVRAEPVPLQPPPAVVAGEVSAGGGVNPEGRSFTYR
jgi:hypothetical protein